MVAWSSGVAASYETVTRLLARPGEAGLVTEDQGPVLRVELDGDFIAQRLPESPLYSVVDCAGPDDQKADRQAAR